MEVKFPLYTDEAADVVRFFSIWLGARPRMSGYSIPDWLRYSSQIAGLDSNGQVTLKINAERWRNIFEPAGYAGPENVSFSQEVVFASAAGKNDFSMRISFEELFRDFFENQSSYWMKNHLLKEDREADLQWKRFEPMPKLSDKFTGQMLDPFTSSYIKTVLSNLVEERAQISEAQISAARENNGIEKFLDITDQADERAKKDIGRSLYWFLRFL